MVVINAVTAALQGGPLGIAIGLGVASVFAGCAMLIAKYRGLFEDRR